MDAILRFYWNASVKEYWEVFTKKKNICPNRSSNTEKPTTITTAATTNTKPTYYNKKPWTTTPKPKMSNSFELLTGPIETVQTKYEVLSDLVTEHGGMTHGSQSHIGPNNSTTMSLIVYYEVPLGQREEIKQKFNNLVRNTWLYNKEIINYN
jgi:hypothetical protein